jgi:hypothetical protein
VVSYKCLVCKFHIGRNGKPLEKNITKNKKIMGVDCMVCDECGESRCSEYVEFVLIVVQRFMYPLFSA